MGGLFFAVILSSSGAAPAPPQNQKVGEVRFASYNLENYTLVASDRARVKAIPSRDAVADVSAEVHPDILGVCEVGSREALADLQERLRQRGVDLPHAEFVNGPDPDRHLALLSRFEPVRRDSRSEVPFELNGLPEWVRRGFLDVTLQVNPRYELRLVGVHLKSKLPSPAGEALLRRSEAQLLRRHIDGILQENPSVNLVVYGDFNETKEEPGIREVLGPRGGINSLGDLLAEDSNGDRWTHFRAFSDVYSRIDFLLVNQSLRPELVSGSARISQNPQWRKASDHRMLYFSLNPRDR
jgi:endonuclease/exonuclease/phosphatase family metal-dependent hydrolase